MNNTISLLYLPESRGQVVISIYRIGLFDAAPTRPSPARLTSEWPGVGQYLQETPDYSSKTNCCAFSNRSRQLAQKFKVARINHPNLQKMEPARLLESDRMDDRQQLSARRKKKTENRNKIIYRQDITDIISLCLLCTVIDSISCHVYGRARFYNFNVETTSTTMKRRPFWCFTPISMS